MPCPLWQPLTLIQLVKHYLEQWLTIEAITWRSRPHAPRPHHVCTKSHLKTHQARKNACKNAIGVYYCRLGHVFQKDERIGVKNAVWGTVRECLGTIWPNRNDKLLAPEGKDSGPSADKALLKSSDPEQTVIWARDASPEYSQNDT